MQENHSQVGKNIAWITGVITIILSVSGWIFFLQLMPENIYYSIPGKSWFSVMFFYFLFALILGVIGLIVGIKQRKAASRLSAILGIVIPIIAILLTLYSAFGVELSIILSTT